MIQIYLIGTVVFAALLCAMYIYDRRRGGIWLSGHTYGAIVFILIWPVMLPLLLAWLLADVITGRF